MKNKNNKDLQGVSQETNQRIEEFGEIITDSTQKVKEVDKSSLSGVIVSQVDKYEQLNKIVLYGKSENNPGIEGLLVDSEGNIQVRSFRKSKGSHIILFEGKIDIENVLQVLRENQIKYNKERKNQEPIATCTFSKYIGNPLDTTGIIRVEIHNPIPNANEATYSKLGKVINVQNKKGIDFVTFSSLNDFMYVREKYEIELKNLRKKGRVYFHLDPNESNNAAPTFFIITRMRTIPDNIEELLNAFILKYPFKNTKKEEKAIKTPTSALKPNENNNQAQGSVLKKKQCKGTTAEGKPCKIEKLVLGSEFCIHHQHQDPNSKGYKKPKHKH